MTSIEGSTNPVTSTATDVKLEENSNDKVVIDDKEVNEDIQPKNPLSSSTNSSINQEESKDIESDNEESSDEESTNNSTPSKSDNKKDKKLQLQQEKISKREQKKFEKEEKERLKREEKEEKERLKREEKERIEQEKLEKEKLKREERDRQKQLKSTSKQSSNRSLKSTVSQGGSSSNLNQLVKSNSNDQLISTATTASGTSSSNLSKEESSEELNNNNNENIDNLLNKDQDTNSSELDDSVDEINNSSSNSTGSASPIPTSTSMSPSPTPISNNSSSNSNSNSGDKREVVIKVTRAFTPVVHQNVLTEEGETKMRNKVINELINTEKDYIADLKVIIHVILAPLRESKLLTDRDITTIFSNIQMLMSVNEVLLADLEKTAKENLGSSIGPCFKQLADYLKMYSSYCSNQQISHDHLLLCIKKMPAFKQFLDERQALPECRQCHLDSFLIKPIQRLCKYPLLIRELIKNSVENHPDIPSLEEAYSKIQAVVLTVNENKRKAEVQQRMYKIHEQLETTEKFDFLTPTRYLIREDTLKELTEEKDKIAGKSHYFLFNDIIMRTKKDKKSIKLETLFVIASTTITDNESRVNSSFCNTFELAQVGSAGRKFTIVCDTYEQKMEWMTDIEQLIRPYQEEYIREYEKHLDDFDPSKFKRSTIATGNPSTVDNSPKSLIRSATASGLSTKQLPAVPSKPLPPPPPSHKSSINLIKNNEVNSANSTPTSSSPRTSIINSTGNSDSPRTSTVLEQPKTTSPRSSLVIDNNAKTSPRNSTIEQPKTTSPRSSLVMDNTRTSPRNSAALDQPNATSSPTTTVSNNKESTNTQEAKAPLPFIVKPKPPAAAPRKPIATPEHTSQNQPSPTPSPAPAPTQFKPVPQTGGRPLPNPSTMKPRALPQPTQSPVSAPVTTPSTSSPTPTSPTPSSTPSPTPPPIAPRPTPTIAFPKSAAALKNSAPTVSRSYSTLPSNTSSFSQVTAPAHTSTNSLLSPSKDDNSLTTTKRTVAPILPPTTQSINKLPPKTTTPPVIPPRGATPNSPAPSTHSVASVTDSPNSKPLPTPPPPIQKPTPPPRR